MRISFPNPPRRSLAAVFLSFIVAFPLFSIEQACANPPLMEARVSDVNDGDTVTLIINGRSHRTRLIGIDAPEIGQKPWGGRSKEHLLKIIKQGNWMVYVETDVVKIDKYNRLLAYLWTRDKEFINERMLLDGYAVLFTIQPNSKHVQRFRKAQRIARQEKRGIWGHDGLKEKPLDYKKRHPRE